MDILNFFLTKISISSEKRNGKKTACSTKVYKKHTQQHLDVMIEQLFSIKQTKEESIIKFYKLAATKNKLKSTVWNELGVLTESSLRTITLM